MVGSIVSRTMLDAEHGPGNTVGTFKALDQGYIAQFLGGQPYFFFGPSLPTARHYFDPFAVQFPLPQVDVLYAHRELCHRLG